MFSVYEKDRGFMETSLDTKIMKKSLSDMREQYRQKADILEGYWGDQ